MNPAPSAKRRSKGQAATARVTVLMTPAEKDALFARAQREGFESVGAYLRRKAFGEDEREPQGLRELRKRVTRLETVVGPERLAKGDPQ